MKLSTLQVVGLGLLILGALGGIVLSSFFWWFVGEQPAPIEVMRKLSLGKNAMDSLMLIGILLFLWELGKVLEADSISLASWAILLILIILSFINPLWPGLFHCIGVPPFLAFVLSDVVRILKITMIGICVMLLISTARKGEGMTA